MYTRDLESWSFEGIIAPSYETTSAGASRYLVNATWVQYTLPHSHNFPSRTIHRNLSGSQTAADSIPTKCAAIHHVRQEARTQDFGHHRVST